MTTLQIYALVWLAFVFGLSIWLNLQHAQHMIPASIQLARISGLALK